MRRLFVSLAVLVAVLACAGPAFGHAAFAGSDPAPGARLESSPPRITLVFTEPLSGRLARATLRTAGGGEVPASVQVDGPRLRVTPSRPLERGAYIVQWHTVSTEDGHALEGTVSFGVRAPAGAAPALETGPLARGGWARILARAALYTTILLLAAALLLPLLIRRPRGWPVPELSDEGPRRAGLPGGAEPVAAGSGPPDAAMVPGGPQPVTAGRAEPGGAVVGGGGQPVAAGREPGGAVVAGDGQPVTAGRAEPGGGVAVAASAPRAAGGQVDLIAVRARVRRLRGDLAWAAVASAVAATVADAADAARGVEPARLADYLLGSVPGAGRVVVVAALVASALLRERAPRAAAAAVVVGLGGIAASGHAGSADPRLPSILNDWLHLVSAALWLGGIGLLALIWWPEVRLTRRVHRIAVARHVLAPFGRVALAAFALVVATGLVSLVTQVGRLDALWETGYGRLLAVKVALVALIAAASFVHALRLRPAMLARGAPEDRRREELHWRLWRREPWLALAVVAAVAGLVAFPLPPRQLAEAGEARIPACDPCALPRPAADELGVAAAAGSQIAAAWVRRTPKAVTGTVRLLDWRGRPSAVPVELPGAATAPCGTGCRRFRLPPAATAVEVAVRERGRRYAVSLPATWERGADRRARRLLARAEATMRSLRGVRELERLTSGPGTGATTEYRLRAPDRLEWRTGRGVRSLIVDRRQWLRTPGMPWREDAYGSGLGFRTRSWFAWSRYARTVRLLGARGGRAELALMDEGTPVWFRLTIDLRTHRVLRERMVARARFTDTRFTDFGRRFTIEPPARSRR